MAKSFKNILTQLSPVCGLRLLQDLSGRKPVFPLYHAVGDNSPAHLKHVQNVRNIAQFEKDLETFLKYFEPVTVIEYLASNRRRNRDRMVLTFDDGLIECADVIAPILKRKGIPAIFFLNSNFLDNQSLFYRYKASLLVEAYEEMKDDPEEMDEAIGKERKYARQVLLDVKYENRLLLDSIAKSIGFSFEDYLKKNPVYLSSSQVSSLISDGFEIGSHSFDHPDFDRMDANKAREQILESVADIGRRFDQKGKYFSFPFSSDAVSLKMIDGLLKDDQVDAIFGTSGLKHYPHPGFIQRIPMEVPELTALQILKTEFLYYIAKAPIGKNTYRGG